MAENEWDDDNFDPSQDNAQFQKLRAHARDLEKGRKADSKELEELRTFKAEAEKQARSSTVREIVASLGLPAKVGNLYQGEPTPEGIADWVREYGDVFGVAATPEVEETEDFTPARVGTPPSTRLTYKQYRELLQSDPQKAVQAVADGRVEGMYQAPESSSI